MVKTTKKKSKKKESYHIANTKNSIVKSILSLISDEINEYQKNDKLFIKKYFNNKCAYTGELLTPKTIEFDHLIPANIAKGGLSLLGNMVPTTKSTNRIKSDKDYLIFLKENNLRNEEREKKIIEYQSLFHYPKNYYNDDIGARLNKLVNDFDEMLRTFTDEIFNQIQNDKEIKNIDKLNFEEKLEVYKVINNSKQWLLKTDSAPYKILQLFFQLQSQNDEVIYKEFKKILKVNKINNLSNLININKNNYGKVFEINNDLIQLWKPTSAPIRALFNI